MALLVLQAAPTRTGIVPTDLGAWLFLDWTLGAPAEPVLHGLRQEVHVVRRLPGIVQCQSETDAFVGVQAKAKPLARLQRVLPFVTVGFQSIPGLPHGSRIAMKADPLLGFTD